MTAGRDWAHEAPRPGRGFRLPWLALAGVAATIAAATALVLGIGDTLDAGGSPGRLMPLQAASPTAGAPVAPPGGHAYLPAPATDSPETRMHDALLKLRLAVDRGVQAGDVRGDAGLDLTTVIEQILARTGSPLGLRSADISRLHQEIAVRTRKGAITRRRADELHLILDRAT